MAHTYRVIKAFASAGEAGNRFFQVGETLTLDRPARSLSHLEPVEGTPVFVGNPDEGDAVTGDGSGESLLPVDSGEGEGVGQPIPVIEPFEEYLGEPVKPKGKSK